jgi:hypothetical protein
MALLGAILVNPRAYERVSPFLKPEHFCLAEHRRIYENCAQLVESGQLADVVTMKSHFDNTGVLEQVGGPGYLNKLVDCAVTVINAGEYGRLVYELHLRREYIAAGEDIVNWAYGHLDERGPAPPGEVLEKIDSLRWRAVGSKLEGLEKYAFCDIHLVKTPPVDPLLGGWLHRQSRAFVSGAKKSGKSFLTMELMRAVGAGERLLHWAGSGKPVPVLYVDGELGVAEFQARQKCFLERYDGDRRRLGLGVGLHFDIFPIPPIDTQAGQQMVLNAAEQIGAGLVILDNWTALTDETLSDDTTTKAIRPLLNELMRRRIGSISVVHAGHDETRPVGSYAQGALMTSLLHLTRDPDAPANECRGMVTWQNTRSARPNDPDYRDFAYELDAESSAFVEQGGGQQRRRQPQNAEVRWALEQIDQCLFNYGVVLAGCAIRPPGTSAVTRKQLTEWFRRRGEGTDADYAKLIKKLLIDGFLARDGDYLWRC